VSWNNVPAWTVVHDPYVTPNLAPIIQEVTNRSDWTPGNALVIIVTGSGRREAESYDGADYHGDIRLVPALHIAYTGP
jgi:hypothetical protein